ncbi:histone deacetylase HDT1 isoform X1 [Citrus sinensis]|uniref:histone deacetylase HDT1 isoform X1 n=1 Tax=Citrus sinensis TaxID=2711 RepID=UPI0003D6F5C6|nr:histone deacetylase HDT1 isoform X1 [Citrus sinensis]
MSTLMEFWGVEVKSGQPLKINPGDNKIVHLSQASLGEIKKDKGSESVYLYLKVDDKKLVLGTLSAQKFPQFSFDLAIEKDFELSHNWKNGSVYFTGYKLRTEGTDDDDNSDSDEDKMDIRLVSNGKPELQAKPLSEKPIAVEPSASTAKQNKKDVKPKLKADGSDSDDSDLNTSSSDDDETSDDENPNLVNRDGSSDESSGELDESDDDEDDEGTDESESDDEDEETPKKAESSKKRPVESASKTYVPDKKAKFVTPQKTEEKKGVSHIATPHPSKKSAKTPANNDQTKQQPHKSGGSFPCKSCNRSFTTEGGLQSHTKAKHGAPA